VLSLEHDPSWYVLLERAVQPPSQVLLRPLGSKYERPVDSILEFQLIVIDGRHRAACAEFVREEVAGGRFANGLMVVFDDTHRTRYRDAIQQLRTYSREYEVFSGTTSEVLEKLTTVMVF